jgi:hypothetical protein
MNVFGDVCRRNERIKLGYIGWVYWVGILGGYIGWVYWVGILGGYIGWVYWVGILGGYIGWVNRAIKNPYYL